MTGAPFHRERRWGPFFLGVGIDLLLAGDTEIMLGRAALTALLGDGQTYVDLYDPERFTTFLLRLGW